MENGDAIAFSHVRACTKNQPLVEMVLESKALVISCIFFTRLHYTGATGWIQLLYHYLCNGIACYTVVILNDKPNFAKLF